jgi:hypothetical protein
MSRRSVVVALVATLLTTAVPIAQTRRSTAAKPAPPAEMRTEPAKVNCPQVLGQGVQTARTFCDVVITRDPAEGIIVQLPAPHRRRHADVRSAQPSYLFGGVGEDEPGLPALHGDGGSPGVRQHASRQGGSAERIPHGQGPIRSDLRRFGSGWCQSSGADGAPRR